MLDKETVRQIIVRHSSTAQIDEVALDKTVSYLNGNGYEETDVEETEGNKCLAYFVYDIIAFTS